MSIVIVTISTIPGHAWEDASSYVPALFMSQRAEGREGWRTPYEEPGRFFQVQDGDAHVSSWIPWDGTTIPDYVRALHDFHLGNGTNSRYHSPAPSPPISLDFLRNRTVVHFGDSVDRNHMDVLCQGSYEQDQWVGDLHTSLNLSRVGGTTWADCHMCYLPRLDLLLLNVMHYGIIAGEEEWKHKPEVRYPASSVGKLERLEVSLRSAGRELDFLVLNSGSVLPSFLPCSLYC